jgi:ATP-dependent Clp protease ATP-binding subunit ClpE
MEETSTIERVKKMLCQNCHENEATIHLYANVNGQRKQLDYCQSCYQKLKNQAGGAPQMAGNDPFGFGSLDDLFRSMSQQMQQRQGAADQTPPTQFGGGNGMNNQPPRGNGGGGLLDEYGINITGQAREGNIDPVVGRDDEIQRVIEILNRRTKNNPVLIGEPGVGKTAVVEGLAQKNRRWRCSAKINGQRSHSFRCRFSCARYRYSGTIRRTDAKIDRRDSSS